LLRQKIDLLSRKIFGCSSEKLSPGQLHLLLELAGTVEEPKAPEPAEPEPAIAVPPPRKERKPRLGWIESVCHRPPVIFDCRSRRGSLRGNVQVYLAESWSVNVPELAGVEPSVMDEETDNALADVLGF